LIKSETQGAQKVDLPHHEPVETQRKEKYYEAITLKLG
jgi:hypothetical protein